VVAAAHVDYPISGTNPSADVVTRIGWFRTGRRMLDSGPSVPPRGGVTDLGGSRRRSSSNMDHYPVANRPAMSCTLVRSHRAACFGMARAGTIPC